MENREERFFSELAKAYAEDEGSSARDELAALEACLPGASGLDKKIKARSARHRLIKYGLRALLLAASLIVAAFFLNSYWVSVREPGGNGPMAAAPAEPSAPDPAAPSEPQPPAVSDRLLQTVEFVKASLPQGYTLTGVDYDNAAAVMQITNGRGGIVLLAEEYYEFNKDGFTAVTVNGSEAYGLVKNDYCVLKYRKGDMLYTLTGTYPISDLAEIIGGIL